MSVIMATSNHNTRISMASVLIRGIQTTLMKVIISAKGSSRSGCALLIHIIEEGNIEKCMGFYGDTTFAFSSSCSHTKVKG